MYSPYSTLGSNQQAYIMAAGNSKQNNKYQNSPQSNFDYYDYYDYGNSVPNQQQNRYRQNQNLQQQRQFGQQGANSGQFGQQSANSGLLGGLNRRMSNMKAAASGGYGSYSGDDYCDNGISIGLLLTAALGIAVMFYTLYTKITMAGGRRRRKKRSEAEELLEEVEEDIDPIRFSIDHITDFLYSGK